MFVTKKNYKYINFFFKKFNFLYNTVGYERFLRFLFNPDIQKKTIFRVDYEKLKYEGYIDEFIDWCIFFKGFYQKEEINIIKEFSSINLSAIDIGSFCGTHSLIMSKYFKHVYSFEPNKISFKRQKQNININKIKNISLINVSISDKKETANYYFPKNGKLSETSLLNSDLYSEYNQDTTKSITLDSFIYSNNITDIGFVKIDAEYFEKKVLEGSKKAICDNKLSLMIEFNFKSKDSLNYNFLRKIFDSNYKIYSLNRKIKNLIFYKYYFKEITRQQDLNNYEGMLFITTIKKIKLKYY